MVSLPCI